MVAQVVELIDVQLADGQQILNVYHFVDPTGVATPATLASDYINDVIPPMTSLQSTGTSHVAVRYRNVFPTATLVQEVTTGLPLAGGLTGDFLPTFYAASGKWTLGSGTVNLVGGTLPHIRKGGTRVGQVTETVTTADTFTSGYNALWATWFSELKDPGTDAFLLCVASFLNAARVRQPTVQQYALVTGSSVPSPSTQNSRKLLRGRSF